MKHVVFSPPLGYCCQDCRVMLSMPAGEVLEEEAGRRDPRWVMRYCPVCKMESVFVDPNYDHWQAIPAEALKA